MARGINSYQINANKLKSRFETLVGYLTEIRQGRISGKLKGRQYKTQLIYLKMSVLKLIAEVNAIRTFFRTRISRIRVNPGVLSRIPAANRNVRNYVSQNGKKIIINPMPPISQMTPILRAITNAATESNSEFREAENLAANAARQRQVALNDTAKEKTNRTRSENNTAALKGLEGRLANIGPKISSNLDTHRKNNTNSPPPPANRRGSNAGSPPSPPPAPRAPYNPFNEVANGRNLINKLKGMEVTRHTFPGLGLADQHALQVIKNGSNRNNRLSVGEQIKYARIVRNVKKHI
jgi:hypothetical protein